MPAEKKFPHAVDDAASSPRATGAGESGNADGRTCTTAQSREVERRENARRAREVGTATMARAMAAACEKHRRGQTGIALLLDVPHQHVSQWCKGTRTLPGWVSGALHALHPVAHAAMEATLREAFGAHHEVEDATPLDVAHEAVMSGAAALALAKDGIEPSEADGFEDEGRRFIRIGGQMVQIAKAARGPGAA